MAQDTAVALIAAGSAIAGLVISQVTTAVIAWLTRRQQKQVLLRQKYEEVATIFSDSMEWFQKVGEAKTVQETFTAGLHDKARKAYMLTLVYFPDLRAPAGDYLARCSDYGRFLIQHADFNAGTPIGLHAAKSPDYVQVEAELTDARKAFETALVQNAEKYVKA